MAITGSGLLLFVIGHTCSAIFRSSLGKMCLNAYAQKLKDMPALLWLARFGLIAVFCRSSSTCRYISVEVNRKSET